MPEPDVRYGHAASEADLAIDNDRAAVVPPVKSRELAELRRAELLHFAARRNQRLEVVVGHLHAAEAVEQDAHGHTLALFLFERAKQVVAEFPVRPDVDRKINRTLRLMDAVE